jgi:N-acetylglucosamine-6-sulfatase
VFDALERRGVLENTLVLYMGDNGFLLGEHGLFDKRVMHEPSIRVPLVAHCPSMIRPGQVIDAMALNIDICPTLLDAAGVRTEAWLHGHSLLPLLRGETSGWRKEFLYEYLWDYEALHTPTVLGLRTEDHALMEYQGIWDINELYDLKSDPEQKNNLLAGTGITTQAGGWLARVSSRELRSTAADLHRRMVGILKETQGQAWLSGPPV